MRKVIYTCLTGGYEKLPQPEVTAEDFDYICFTDDQSDGETRAGVWQVKPIPFVAADKARLSRYPKMHPHILLPEYDYSVYIDANVVICNNAFYELVNSKIDSGVLLSGIKHKDEDCMYREFYNAYKNRKLRNEIITAVKEYYYIKAQGFPEHFGMYEANVILRRHNHEKVVRQCELWWETYNKFTSRDQLCYMFTIWKSGIPVDYLIYPKNGERNFDYFHLIEHPLPMPHNALLRLKERVIYRYYYWLPGNRDFGYKLFSVFASAVKPFIRL